MRSESTIIKPVSSYPIERKFWRAYTHFVVDHTFAAIVAIDEEECITIFNRQAELVFKKKASDLIGKPITKVFPNLAVHEHYLLITLNNGRETREVETYYCPYTDQEGVFIHSVALVKSASGTVGGAIWMRKDLTKTRRFQNEINNAEVQAIVSQIAAGTAHEIRNPLTTAKGYIQLARQKADAAISTHLDLALAEIDEIEHIITDLLSLFHPSAEGLQFVSLNGLLQTLLHLVENAGTLAGIVIRSILDKQVPLCLIDVKLIRQALLNILRNAMEAMPLGGELTVHTSYDVGAVEICITISDTGIGIETEHLSKIFQPFYTTKNEGSGLGLTLANRIIQHHNGYMDIESVSGQGTHVQIHLPLQAGKASTDTK
ncbi:MAG: ATP-binding protein [Firmicutes bacterium]|nr:ATP-binding protein [Bacillota bacterium]